MLHAAHAAAQGYEAIVLVADDTDVFVLSLAFSDDIGAAMYIKGGTQFRTQYTDRNTCIHWLQQCKHFSRSWKAQCIEDV